MGLFRVLDNVAMNLAGKSSKKGKKGKNKSKRIVEQGNDDSFHARVDRRMEKYDELNKSGDLSSEAYLNIRDSVIHQEQLREIDRRKYRKSIIDCSRLPKEEIRQLKEKWAEESKKELVDDYRHNELKYKSDNGGLNEREAREFIELKLKNGEISEEMMVRNLDEIKMLSKIAPNEAAKQDLYRRMQQTLYLLNKIRDIKYNS